LVEAIKGGATIPGEPELARTTPFVTYFLFATGDQVLVEASPYDRIWCIGLKATDENAQNPANWQGQNLLGFALMDVRARLWA
jgi:ribA/ribD-fused uncharacterized protein